jgi:uncharacterized protein (DUF58 family)
MFSFRNHTKKIPPPEVVTNLDELMRMEYFILGTNVFPQHSVHALLAGRHNSKLRGRGLDFEEVRLYVAGDDIRNIDWRVTARTGQTHSKVFNEEKERPVFTIVDQSSYMFFGSRLYMKSVIAAEAAALAGFHTLHRGDRFGGIIFNDEDHEYIYPKRSKALLQHYLQHIVDKNIKLPERKILKPNREMLRKTLQRTASVITHDYVVTVISDFSMMDDEIRQCLIQLSEHNDVILVHITDPMDSNLPDSKLVIGDGKYQITWNNKKKNWGRKYQDSFTRLETELTEKLKQYNIPVMILNTTKAVNDQLTDIMSVALKT